MTTEREARQSVIDRLAALTTTWVGEQALQADGRWWSWGDVARTVRALADHCDSRGLPSDTPIVIVVRQRPSLVAAELAALAGGRTAVLVSALVADRVLVDDLTLLRPAVVVAHDDDWRREGVEDAIRALGSLGLDVADDGELVVRIEGSSPLPDFTFPDSAITVLTSGTTGKSKRLPISWSNFVVAGGGAPGRPPVSGRGALILALPLVTIGGTLSMSRLIFGGRPMSMMERFDVETWVDLIGEHRPTVIGAPPPVVKMILDANIDPTRFAGVTAYITASAALDPAIGRAFEEKYGFPVLLGYGATEFLGAVSGWTPEMWSRYGIAKAGSVGQASGGARLKVVDVETGVEVEPGVEGVLEVDPPRRADGLPEGWLRTSDRARIDADGFLWILGRLDDVIIRGGFKVDLGSVETALRAHRCVDDALAVGLPDERVGTVPAALVTLVRDCDCSIDEITESTRDHLPPYGVPVRVKVVDQIPRTATMKPARAEALRLLTD